jgi:YaiO family outer membrane protein
MHRYLRRNKIKYEMPFIPDPVAWTEVPESLKILSRQRERWHRGLIAAMWEYKSLLFNPRYGRIGFLAMPFYAFGEMLAPIVELLGYLITVLGLAFGMVNVSFALLFVLVAWGYGMLLSIWAVVLEEVSFRRYRRFGDLFRLLLFATLENFGYRQCTVWWRLKAFAKGWKRTHAWGEMTRKGFGKASAAALLALGLATPCLGQSVRISAWSSYEAVTASQDWSAVGAQFTVTTPRGHGASIAAEILGRFGETDVTERVGGVIHPARRLWLTAEAGTAREPVFMPKNTWEADATALVASRAAAGIAYRRLNYAAGPVDIVTPHLTVETGRMSWSARVYVSRNPSRRTDTAVLLRAARALTRRTTVSLLGAAGRESYLVGSVVRSLETVTGAAGIRYNAGSGMTLRFDASVIRSRPVLSRSGIAVGVERGL